MRRRHLLGAAVAASAAAVTGCGTTDAPVSAEGPTSAAGSGAAEITVTDATGRTVTLPGVAQRVTALEWGNVEEVVSLGVQPAGVADVKGYTDWVSAAPLTGDTVDVGLRSEPSIESVAKADPDLLLGIVGSIPDSAMAQMKKIAPVVLLTGADASRQDERMRADFTTTAQLLGRQSEAAALLAELDARVDAAKAKIADAGKAGVHYVFAYPAETGNQVSFRMHSSTSLPGVYAAKLGLKNAWTEPGDKQWGIGDSDVEAMTTLPDDTEFCYWGNVEGDAVTGTLARNAVWKGLPFVKRGRVHKAAEKIWVYGGPASMMQWVDDLADKITS